MIRLNSLYSERWKVGNIGHPTTEVFRSSFYQNVSHMYPNFTQNMEHNSSIQICTVDIWRCRTKRKFLF